MKETTAIYHNRLELTPAQSREPVAVIVNKLISESILGKVIPQKIIVSKINQIKYGDKIENRHINRLVWNVDVVVDVSGFYYDVGEIINDALVYAVDSAAKVIKCKSQSIEIIVPKVENTEKYKVDQKVKVQLLQVEPQLGRDVFYSLGRLV
jgi:hypothetical protein